MEEPAAQIIKRADAMKSARGVFDAHWQDVRDVLLPTGAAFNRVETPGTKGRAQVLDASPEMALEMLAADLHRLLTDPGTKWFLRRPLNPALEDNERVMLALEEVTNRQFAGLARPSAFFQTAMHEQYMDLAAYGTSCLYMPELPGRGLQFQARALNEMYLAENSQGRIDTWYRRFSLTARQAVQEWGKAVGEKIGKAALERPDLEFEFIHAVQPRGERDYASASARNMPYASCYVGLADKNLIREGGYMEAPFVSPRWSRRAGEVYGRGPGTKMLPDARMLQRAMRSQIRGVEKAIDPTLMVSDDGVMGKIRTSANGLIYVRDGINKKEPIRPLLTGARPDLGEEFMKGVRDRIDRGFYNNLLQMLRDPRMTATQVMQIVEETQRVMGPIVARLASELLEPMLDRQFSVMWRNGEFDDIDFPPELAGEILRIEHVSPLARQQQLSEPRAMAQTLEVMAPLLNNDPAALDIVNTDDAFRRVAHLFGWPQKTLNARDKVVEIREARASANAQAQQMQNMAMQAEAVGKALPALTEAAAPMGRAA